MFTTKRINTIVIVLIFLLQISRTLGQEYSATLDLFNEKLSSSNYNPKVRPILKQSAVLEVQVGFELVSIVEVDDIQQSFTCNGFLAFYWRDEILVWNSSQYGGQKVLHPFPEDIWRPRVVVMNTLKDRDPFKDDYSPVFVSSDGWIYWIPGSLFATYCELDLTDYPFDHQTCTIQFVAMTLSSDEMSFKTMSTDMGLTFFTKNGEWELLDTSMKTSILNTGSLYMSSIEVTFVMKRRPNFLLINIILPVVFLSFLNLLVFFIPVNSGEKVGYGITVLLALSVYMSIVSNLLPSSSSTTPRLTLYLFILLIFSMLTVIVSIVIVFIHNLEEREVAHLKAKANFRSALKKVNYFRTATARMENLSRNDAKPQEEQSLTNDFSKLDDAKFQHGETEDRQTQDDSPQKPKVNKYKLIGKHIDLISFVIFFIIWIGVTLGFLFSIAF
ncbi:acetylcholine receptor subunit alpha-like [Physella acuta]|uniref:acetylcholine receptor subunit alpha-like n=1 Tax=Physella acuta TaxID=109671 RepID=UPI0027DCE6DF|nr:acetylcholine receptor subunit alpha-like [Physella acuta]